MKITKKQLQEMVRREIKRTIKEQVEDEGKNPRIIVYYETWDEESLSTGETDDKGMIDEIDVEPDDEDVTVDEWAADYLQGVGVEPSSTQFHSGIWYTTVDLEEDPYSDRQTSYTFHLKGFTPEEEKEVYKQVKRGY